MTAINSETQRLRVSARDIILLVLSISSARGRLPVIPGFCDILSRFASFGLTGTAIPPYDAVRPETSSFDEIGRLPPTMAQGPAMADTEEMWITPAQDLSSVRDGRRSEGKRT